MKSTDARGATDPDEKIEVKAAWGYLLAASTIEIIDDGRGLSCGARGIALIAQGLGHIPTPEEVQELTGDEPDKTGPWFRELHGTGYLFWEG